MKPCEKCNNHFCRDDEVPCDGFCGRIYHLQCSGANQYDIMRCAGSNNLLWVCDACLLLIKNQQQSQAAIVSMNADINKTAENTVQSTVLTLEQKVDEIAQQLSNLQEQIHQNVTLSHPSTSTPKRSDYQQKECNSDMERFNGSRLLNGSKVICKDSNNRCSTVLPDFWIYLTGIANHVSEDDVGKMVSDCLKLDQQPVVTKLVPYWRNAKDLRYISFKVGVNHKFKNEALLENTWPVGVRFREFINYDTSLWQP